MSQALFATPLRYRQSNLVLSIAGKTVRITFDIADPVQFSMVGHFDFDLMTSSIVAAALKGGDTFVDVGANWGYFTCIGASQVGPTGLVLAIEPSRVANRRLHETVRRNRLANVMIVQYAAGSVVGRGVSIDPWQQYPCLRWEIRCGAVCRSGRS